jgi:hypothetical protein
MHGVDFDGQRFLVTAGEAEKISGENDQQIILPAPGSSSLFTDYRN